MLFPKLLEPCPSLPFRNTPGGKSNRCCFRQVLELWCCSHKGGGGFGSRKGVGVVGWPTKGTGKWEAAVVGWGRVGAS